MKKIGIGVDYSNICKDYNTVYLDRDNTDRETKVCMKKTMEWVALFLSELTQEFNYKIYRLNNDSILDISEIARKRFLFYSLEKEMLLQNFILQKTYTSYTSLAHWGESDEDSLMIKNDDEGEGIYFYVSKDSKLHLWILQKLQDFSLETLAFTEK
ncbi:MAG: hypothetical protein COB42_06600 [Sulfurimonas sp.]|nr:MAG: hypothetical protein COB42_06600 [Sulfurimonas sp.]